MATKKKEVKVPKWVEARVKGAKFKLLKLVPAKRNNFWDGDHAVIQITEPTKVWKWIRFDECSGFHNHHTVELVLPVGAKVVIHKRVSKCRTNQAKYIGKEPGYSAHRPSFKYTPGRIVRARLSPPRNDCGSGIHFCFGKGQVQYY